MKEQNTITAIVPFFNEEQTLDESVQRLISSGIFNQIILSDDSSSDKSAGIAKKIVTQNKNVEYICTQKNGGKGYALQNAQTYINSTHVVIHDADLEYYPEDISEMAEVAKQYSKSLILGSRFLGVKKRDNIYLRTNLANKFLSAFFSIVNFYKITDVATCYKLMPSEFFKSIDIKEKGFSIEIEILSKFLRFNKDIKEVPIKYSGRSYEEGKKIKFSDGIFYLINTLKYRFSNF